MSINQVNGERSVWQISGGVEMELGKVPPHDIEAEQAVIRKHVNG